MLDPIEKLANSHDHEPPRGEIDRFMSNSKSSTSQMNVSDGLMSVSVEFVIVLIIVVHMNTRRARSKLNLRLGFDIIEHPRESCRIHPTKIETIALATHLQ